MPWWGSSQHVIAHAHIWCCIIDALHSPSFFCIYKKLVAIYKSGNCRSNLDWPSLLQRLGQKGVQLGRVRLENVLDAVAVLEEDKGGHAADAELLAQVLQHVDVNLAKVDVFELFVGSVPGRDEYCVNGFFLGLLKWWDAMADNGGVMKATRGRE